MQKTEKLETLDQVRDIRNENTNRLKNLDIFMDNPALIVFKKTWMHWGIGLMLWDPIRDKAK